MKNQTDKELICQIKKGEEYALDVLLERYKILVKQICRGYFLIGGETEDLLQEGMIGLYKACKTYDCNSEASFKTFARLCITRQVKTALKKDNRLKNKPLNSGISLNIDLDDEEEGFILKSDELTPEEIIFQKEKMKIISDIIKNELSCSERDTIKLYLEGLSYNEIAYKLNITTKSVENSLARGRNKIINKLKNIF